MANGEGPVRLEDVAGVRSRLSWQAIFAGAIIAVATNLVLTMFFGALGLTLTETGVRSNAVGVGALIAVLCSILLALFVGGWVSTQLTAGETEREAILYGILTWAAVVVLSALLVGMGLRTGYFALVGGAVVVEQHPAVQNSQNWEQAARNAGVSQQQIDAAKASINPNQVQQTVNDPTTQRRAEEALIGASWAALVGVLFSMATAIGGALAGRGPTFRLLATPQVRAEVRREIIVP